MRKITIEVKDDYVNNIMIVLQGLKGVFVDKIKVDGSAHNHTDDSMVRLQQDSMRHVWDNQEDEAWNDL